ncbi:hypothetical protein M902_1549 [Bacteriovorax sp. BAL6_X]|uniref:CFI-box-CTERM domain-containing protein n=1 Tax=Bacteriovorax sp. BAL6_X TaxID=1201290 RepID=UPI000385CAA0|nr:CFI-box-CTERM domain-containing protein [Bacteriovorax sp. BAL6_X]EPZ50433.1 hypothetical protein M902_1549 [Bacteriovorax sp. BAL6_X]
MATKKPQNKSKDGEEELNEGVRNAYSERLKTLKLALDFVAKNDIPHSVEKFNHYLGILAAYNRTTEKHLTPKMFDPQKDISELLLISQAYWNLAKSYDKSPKLRGESMRCLQQFIAFSIGYKYQHANAQIVKKFLRSGQAHNKKVFQQAYDKINVRSKNCYLATHAYPNNEDLLNTLRGIKPTLAKYKLGQEFINYYYEVSPHIVKIFKENKSLDFIFNKLLIKPLIYLIYKILR